MKVLIDFTQIPLNKVGVGIYGYNFISQLAQNIDGNQYYVVILSDEHCFKNLKSDSIHFIVVNKFFRTFVFRFFIEQFYLPFLAIKYRIDIIHSLHYSFPILLRKVNKIVTIHDLTFFLFPKLHKTVKVFYFKFFTLIAGRFCSSIICVSHSTKNDLLKFTKTPESKIEVIHLGCDDMIKTFTTAEKSSVRQKFMIPQTKKLLLFIGTIEPRKNIITLLESFRIISKSISDLHLVIVGRKGWYYDNILDFVKSHPYDNLSFTGYVTEYEKNVLLSDAYIFVYPSVYEGFGIPVLEALRFSIPTITSNISSLPEVGGEAVEYICPDNQEQMVQAMLKLYFDSKQRELLIENSRIQIRKFSWVLMTKETIRVYNSQGY